MPRSGRHRRELRSLLWRASTRDEVDADIAFHLDMMTRDLMDRQGLSEPQARAEAERRFGDVRAVTEESRRLADERDMNERRAEFRGELRQDVSFALRQLRRSPGFSAMAVLTLALGFGATAAVFSALYAVVLKPLPFDDVDRVVSVRVTARGEETGGTAAEFFALGEHTTKAFEHVAAYVNTGFTIRTGETPELVSGGRVSPDYFRVLGVTPAMGRTFSREEDVPGRDNVAIISNRAWRTRFNEDPAILGSTIQVDGTPRTVIGVMPPSFDVTADFEEIWTPLALTREYANLHSARFLDFFGRLREGVTTRQAEAALVQAVRAAAASDPNRRAPVTDYGAVVHSIIDTVVGDYKSLLLMLLGAGVFVLLIACTNVANLLIARGTVRGRELSIRAALGAGRRRLLRQLLTEAAVLALAGAAMGLAMAFGLLRAVVAVSPEGVPRLEQASVDLRVLGFTLVCAAASTVLFGLVPAFRVTGESLERALRAGGRTLRGGRDRLRAVLVGAEVALAMTLLVGAGLLIRSALHVQRVDPGFDANGVITARVLLPESRYPDPPRIVAFYDQLQREASQLPAVDSAALVSMVPLSGSNAGSSVFSEEQSLDDPRPVTSNLRLASGGYFATMRIPLRAGRDISSRDVSGSPKVMVINETLASKLWPGVALRDVLGRRINAIAPRRNEPNWWEVVGVVGDLHSEALSADVAPEFYIPVAQTPSLLWPLIQRSLVLVARTRNDNADAETLDRPVRELVSGIDPNLPVADMRTMTRMLRGSQATARFNTLVLGTLGAIALLLAVIGVYGVVSYFVSQRTQDIAVRMALGATPLSIWKYVAARGLLPLVAGVVVGTALSMATAQLLESRLYRVSPHDPLTIGATALLLLVVSVIATYAPARRAIRVQPVEALSG